VAELSEAPSDEASVDVGWPEESPLAVAPLAVSLPVSLPVPLEAPLSSEPDADDDVPAAEPSSPVVSSEELPEDVELAPPSPDESSPGTLATGRSDSGSR
jgi:hypothetical protein